MIISLKQLLSWNQRIQNLIYNKNKIYMTQFLQQSFPEMTVQIKTVARMQIYSKIYPKNFPIITNQ